MRKRPFTKLLTLHCRPTITEGHVYSFIETPKLLWVDCYIMFGEVHWLVFISIIHSTLLSYSYCIVYEYESMSQWVNAMNLEMAYWKCSILHTTICRSSHNRFLYKYRVTFRAPDDYQWPKSSSNYCVRSQERQYSGLHVPNAAPIQSNQPSVYSVFVISMCMYWDELISGMQFRTPVQ